MQRRDDGTRIVWGKVTDGTLDRDGQIVDPEWAADRLKSWFSDLGAPIRNMHSGTYPPAGKGVDLTIQDDGSYVRAKVVEPTAIRLIDEEVYKDFSIGICDAPIFPDARAPGGRIGDVNDPDGWINEVSLVDLGSNKNSHFSLAKRAKASSKPRMVYKFEGERSPEEMLADALKRATSGPDLSNLTFMPSVQKIGAAGQYYTLLKRGLDPAGADTGALEPGDFVLPKTRQFPVVTPGDVADAVSGWGHSRSGKSFETFKQKLTALAQRKGSTFAVELPPAWREQITEPKGKDTTMAKAKTATAAAAPADDDTTKGKGAVPPAFLTDKPGKGKGPKGKDAPPPAAGDGGDGGTEPDADDKTKGKGKTAKTKQGKDPKDAIKGKGKDKPLTSPGDDISEKPGALKTKGKTKGPRLDDVPYVAVRLHDQLCPAFATKSVEAAFGELTPQIISPEWFQEQLAARTSARKARPGDVAEAAEALLAAHNVAALKPKRFAKLREAAAKAFSDAYPDVPNLRPGLINPEAFRRPYLSGATPSASSGAGPRIPAPNPLDPSDFTRGPIGNQARQSLVGGSSVAKAAYGEDGAAASAIHDFLCKSYPGLCPIADAPGSPIDSDGQMGRPAEFYMPPPGRSLLGNGAGATLTPVRDTARANKGAKKAPAAGAGEGSPGAGAPGIDPEVLKGLVGESVDAAIATTRKELRRVTKAYRELAGQADQSKAAQRTHTFTRKADKKTRRQQEKLERARFLVKRVKDRNSAIAGPALRELNDLGLTPEQYARIAASDN